MSEYFMGERVTYCQGWFRAKKRALEALTEAEAKRIHQEGELYTVLLGDPEKPRCFLEVHLKLGFVGVYFLDDKLQVCTEYIFKAKEDNRVFLSEVLYRRFGTDIDKPLEVICCLFYLDGRVVAERRLLLPDGKKVTRKDCTESADLSANWEAVPKFGFYEGVSRSKRPFDFGECSELFSSIEV